MRDVIAAPAAGLDLRQHYGHHQSPAIRAGGLIFCSGMLPVDPQTGERRHGTLTSEAHVIFGNLKLLLESAGSSLDRLVQVHALIYDSIEYFYDDHNRADVVRILVAVSGQKAEDVEKSYDFFRKNNFFDRTGKISRARMNALLDALVGLGDLPARGNIERFLLPGVAQLSD